MFLMLYPVLKSLWANGGWWGAEMQSVIPPNVGKSPRWDRFVPIRVHSYGISGQQSTESMEDMLLMLYPVLGQLGPKGGSWGGMERSSNVEEIPKMRKICTQRSQNWGYLWLTEYTEFMENMFLMFYQVLGSLGA